MSGPLDPPHVRMEREALDAAAELLRVLSHATRLGLLRVLEHGEAPVGDIARAVDVAQPTVSQHLAVLYGAGLVHRRPDGHHVRYHLAAPRVLSLVTIAVELESRPGEATRPRHERTPGTSSDVISDAK